MESSLTQRFGIPCLAVLLAGGAACGRVPAPAAVAPAADMAVFEERIAGIIARSAVPGATGAIARDGEVVWVRGFGMADVEAGAPATASTRYPIASLTKGFAAVAALREVEAGRLSLDAPVADSRIPLCSDTVRVKHLLSMTSDCPPGDAFRYDGDRYSLLGPVIFDAAGRYFADILGTDIAAPLGLSSTTAGLAAVPAGVPLAQGYELRRGVNVRVEYPRLFSPAAGMVSTAADVARFWSMLDGSGVISHASYERLISPAVSAKGDTLPYALGVFSQRYGGERVVWAYGWWTGSSSLMMHVPSTGVTFVVLGNSGQLSAPYGLGRGRLTDSPLAREFLAAFVLPGATLR